MRRYLAIVIAVFFVVACGNKPVAVRPEVNSNIFTDNSAEPCLQVVFPDAVKYDSRAETVSGGEQAIIHKLSMPSKPFYSVTVMKVANESADSEWAMVPVNEMYPSEMKLYERISADSFYGRGAVLFMYDPDGSDIYLRSVVGEYTARDRAFFVMIDRMVFRAEYRRGFSQQDWINSSTGKTFINDMTEITDWFFNNTAVTSCRSSAMTSVLMTE